MKASVETIRAAGFAWPKIDEIDRRMVLDGEQVDLDATREGIEVAAAYYRRQLDEMQAFRDTWDAKWSDISDRREDYTARERELVAAAAYVCEVISGLAGS